MNQRRALFNWDKRTGNSESGKDETIPKTLTQLNRCSSKNHQKGGTGLPPNGVLDQQVGTMAKKKKKKSPLPPDLYDSQG